MNIKRNAIVSEKYLSLKVKYTCNVSHQCLYVIIVLDL